MDISHIQAYTQSLVNRKRQQLAAQEHDRGQHKRAQSIGDMGESRGEDAEATSSTLQLVSVVSEFPDVFPDKLPKVEHLRKVLHSLQDHKLYAKFSKCEFWLNSVAFLGHILSNEGIRVDSQKVEAVKNWEMSTSPAEVGDFLGLAIYYQRFVENFSSIVTPLTKLMYKEAKFQWTDTCEKRFQELKDKLTSTPVLALPKGPEGGGSIVQNTVETLVVAEVKTRQLDDPALVKIRESIPFQKKQLFKLSEDRVLRYKDWLCVPDVEGF
uniref:Reverse transcriptase/retrotransposon-derived protein RNase H-like domain-containing protein n=1 Tax=Nicotiana tabacum TaxID=4097 RepID=A0A1S4BLZ6_TOBAC|nr:PREDICTED: uncharacterized protein LOC107809708 [Nicotiana tabacum]